MIKWTPDEKENRRERKDREEMFKSVLEWSELDDS